MQIIFSFKSAAPLIVTGAIPMSFLVDNCPPKESAFPEKYLGGILRAVVQSAGLEKAEQMWRSERMSVETFVAQDRVKDFVATNVSIFWYQSH